MQKQIKFGLKKLLPATKHYFLSQEIISSKVAQWNLLKFYILLNEANLNHLLLSKHSLSTMYATPKPYVIFFC